ncbi:MAG: ATP-binding cassette domain-containing protein, partial [Anaerolineales bacterium]
LELRRTECAALVGPNGAGKSTFLKTLLGQLPPLEGEVLLGASLHIGYFAQAHEGLDPAKTLVEEIQAVAPNMLIPQARDYLAKYLFSGEDVFKRVGVLSGGERGRLALAKLALEDTNLLLLDEPTNHLDILSQEILEEVLEAYRGTILLVSHDRYLIDALATQIWEIEPDESRLVVFKGTYSELRAQKEAAAQTARDAEQNARQADSPTRAQRRAPADKEERRRLARLQEIENQIVALEARLAELTRALENPPADPAAVAQLGRDYESVQKEMDDKLLEWEGLQG